MPSCECGCNAKVTQGQFLPGHDQKLRTALEAQVGGILPLRSLVRAAQAYFDGSIDGQAFTQTVRGVLSGSVTIHTNAGGDRTTCRDEILECAAIVTKKSGLDHFTVPEIIDCMAQRGSPYAESTIRTHVVSRMCANAPDNHAVTFRDFERTERGTYKIIR